MTYRPVSVNHLTIRVHDLDRTAEFFERVFGWDVDASSSDRRRVQVGNTRLVFKMVLPETPAGDRFSECRAVDTFVFRRAPNARQSTDH